MEIKLVAYTEENIKRNNEIMEHNSKLMAKIIPPMMEQTVKNINKTLKQLALMNHKQ